MMTNRSGAIEQAKKARHWGLILGTLGRQGSPKILDVRDAMCALRVSHRAQHLEQLLKKNNIDYTIVLLSEVFPSKLQKFDAIEACVPEGYLQVRVWAHDCIDGCRWPARVCR